MKLQFKKFCSIIKKYQWKSLFFVYLKQLLVIILIPAVLLFSFTLIHRIKIMKNEYTGLAKSSLEKTEAMFENTAESIDTFYNFVFSNAYAKSFFLKSSENQSNFETYNTKRNIKNIIESYKVMYPFISAVHVYSVKSGQIISMSANISDTDADDMEWLEIYKQTGSCHFIRPTDLKTEAGSEKQLSFSYPIKYGTELDGILVVNIPFYELDKLLKNDKENLYIVENGMIIYSTNRDAVGLSAEESADISPYFSEFLKNGSLSDSKAELKTVWSYIKNTDSDFALISQLDTDDFSNGITSIIASYLIIFFIMLILTVIYSVYNAYKFYYYIADIVIELPDFGKIPSFTEKKHNNELVSIRNSLIEMLEKTETTEKNLAEKMQSLKSAQTWALQSQINPHFIFNTLNLINLTLINSYGLKHTAVKIIELFSEILSGILSSNNYLIPIEDELNYAKKFVEIEKIKTDNSFSVVWEIDDNVFEQKTLKMILQPIIENSVEHGIKKRCDKNGFLKIQAYRRENNIIYKISDNGTGIPSDVLFELTETMKSLDISDCRHLGLKNVHYRINTLCGDGFGVKIESDKNGTSVTITHPILL